MSYIGIELILDSLSELNRFGQHLHCHCDSFALTLWADPSAFDYCLVKMYQFGLL